jgi:peptidoglycan/xylan/chitin deacetylase (PgdA/CDA1 family)
MTWEMVAEMSRGGITIGSHTRTHPVLTRESAQVVLEEVAGSRRTLERMLGTPARHFAYPGGQFNRDVVRAVAGSGYRFGYTACRHRDAEHPLLTVPRTLLWEASSVDARGRFSPAVMSCQIRGVFSARCRELHGDRQFHGAAGGGLQRSGEVHP